MTWPHVIWHITRAAPLSQHVITRLAGLRVITRQPLERTQALVKVRAFAGTHATVVCGDAVRARSILLKSGTSALDVPHLGDVLR